VALCVEWCVVGVECCRQTTLNETTHQQRATPVKSGGHTRRLRTAYTNTQVTCLSTASLAYYEAHV